MKKCILRNSDFYPGKTVVPRVFQFDIDSCHAAGNRRSDS